MAVRCAPGLACRSATCWAISAVQTALQVGKSRDDFAYQVSYLNMRSRWNWGMFTSQVPWSTGSTISHGTIGEPKVVRETDVRREVHRQVHGAAVYPFSSARRLELSGGLQAIGFGSRTITSGIGPPPAG